MSVTRALTLDDVPVLSALVTAERDFLAPWEPTRDPGWFTVDGQRSHVSLVLQDVEQGTHVARVIVDAAGDVVGRINLSGIRRGALQSGALGYWVASGANGRGLATAAVGEVLAHALGDLGLHRVQAETLVHNLASQTVLRRNGFVQYGLAPQYLRIAGRWQDHLMFQVLAPQD